MTRLAPLSFASRITPATTGPRPRLFPLLGAAGATATLLGLTAVQAAGLKGLNDGQKVSYDVAMERGKAAATNLKLV